MRGLTRRWLSCRKNRHWAVRSSMPSIGGALTRYCDDGRVEIDNNAAERAMGAVALGRINYLFAGSDALAENERLRFTVWWELPS